MAHQQAPASMPSAEGADVPALPALPPGGTLVGYADPAAFEDPATQAALRACLDDEELARHGRFRFARDQQIFLVAHALTRGLLARSQGVAPGALRFVSSERGRPELLQERAAGVNAPRLRFNLSHTRGLVACGLCVENDIGVDVEQVDRHTSIDTLAPTVLSPGELADLHAQTPEAVRSRFFEYWTLKEAYLKAVGQGLGLPLRSICFLPPGAPPIASARVTFLPGLHDDPERFMYRCWPIAPAHQLAVAVAGPRDQPLVVAPVGRSALLALLTRSPL